jgi:predicted NBD/HSP70 family sugar kinase
MRVELRTIHQGADDAGLVGWTQLHPHGPPDQAFLAVDIGGTNVRCGIVAPAGAPSRDPGIAGTHAEKSIDRVIKLEKWRHADSDAPQDDLVEGIVGMLRRLIAHAGEHQIPLLPFIGIGCPGVIRSDGSIARGAQNLPGDWDRASFHLPRRISENIPSIDGAKTLVLMHNDAVVQGLSEVSFTRDVRRWAVLTIGTGLGNASFTNQAMRRTPHVRPGRPKAVDDSSDEDI